MFQTIDFKYLISILGSVSGEQVTKDDNLHQNTAFVFR